MFLFHKLGLICKAKKQGPEQTGLILKTGTRFHFSQTKPADGMVGRSLVMQSTASHLRCLHVLYHQEKMSSAIGPTQTAVLGETMPLNSQWGQQGPVSTFQAGLSLTVGEKGFCPGVSTYVLQLRKQGWTLWEQAAVQHSMLCAASLQERMQENRQWAELTGTKTNRDVVQGRLLVVRSQTFGEFSFVFLSLSEAGLICFG